jgi:glucose/arabinose dehydrogenase
MRGWLLGLAVLVASATACDTPGATAGSAPAPTSAAPAARLAEPPAQGPLGEQPVSTGDPQRPNTGQSTSSPPAAVASSAAFPVGDVTVRPVPATLRGRVALRRIHRRLSRPVLVTHAPGDASRLFIVEKTGTIRISRGGVLAREPFLDIASQVSGASEQGLLGLAFHPKFSSNRRLYINFTNRRGDTRVVEYRVDADRPDRVDTSTARELVAVDQPYTNHNGGHLVFGPDGKLWVGLGDGGSAGDPKRAGQDPGTLLAKMFRIDVDAREPTPEIVAMGLRNPWRYAFDPRTGDLYIGDVGQQLWESIYAVPADRLTGHNFGWSVAEGAHCYRQRRCDRSGFTAPVVDYGHTDGCSVTGGMVYRGKALPALDGAYFYADYCTGLLRSFRWSKESGVRDHWDWRPVLDPGRNVNSVSSFGVDAAGELYLVTLVGDVYRLEST